VSNYRQRLASFSAWVLLFCAVVTTFFVARRELTVFLGPAQLTNDDWKAVYVDGWQEIITVGIPSGTTDAPVQIIVFEDFQCSFCAKFSSNLNRVQEKYGSLVNVTVVPYPLPYHEYSATAQKAAECAHSQGRFWAMRSILFEHQESFGSEEWTELARQAQVVDVQEFSTCLAANVHGWRVERAKELSEVAMVRGTPTVVVNGWKFPITPSFEVLNTAVENAVQGRTPTEGIDFLPKVAQE
jgi:protein-disulfide isomerase